MVSVLKKLVAINHGRNVLPDGQIRVQSPPDKLRPRPIFPDEMP